MTTIQTADWHLSSKSRDEYRWKLFDWLLEQEADELLVLGDISDQKDRHDAVFVNRLYYETMRLEQKFRVIYLVGNHDFSSSADQAFFRFLGDSSDIAFISELTELKLSIGSSLFVPALTPWTFKIPKVDWIFTHATFSGAKAETGRSLTGVDPAVVADFEGKIWSGDIHTPQKLLGGKIEYVGAPYHVRFGDEFKPRLVRVARSGGGWATTDLHFPAPRKRTLYITRPEDLDEEDADKGDHVKVRCVLRRAEYDKWRSYREQISKMADDRGWLLFGSEPIPVETPAANSVLASEGEEFELTSADPVEIVTAYAKRHKASDAYLRAGLDVLK